MRRMSLAASLMLGLAVVTVPVMRAHAQVSIGIGLPVLAIIIAPPVLPVYDQPAIPEDGYIWAPGYWAYSDVGYYWVPGTWVLPPEPGLLWTPGYWGYNNGGYGWNAGYWGPHVGFYGGVNYGYGYGGDGYQGGYWQQNHFHYNRNVNNFGGTHITNVYERNVTNVTVNRISYNGGNGGIEARPSQQDLGYQHERRVDPTADQRQQEHLASGNRSLWASQNHGVPAIAATPRPADFTAHGVVAAHNAPENIPPVPQHGASNAGPEHGPNAMAPQHQDHPAPGVVPHPENAMTAQHPEGVQHPENAKTAQPENAMTAQHVPVPEQHAVAPEVNHPAENVQHAQPAFHPQEMAPAQHEPAAPAYHPPVVHEPAAPAYHAPTAPAYHAPAAPAYHPQEARPAQPAPHPQAPRPAAEHPPEQHQQGQDHKPN